MKELITDSRLTPTMDRIRSGRTQQFREKGSANSVGFNLMHPTDKAMYAELIDGKWYWVSGCMECNGQPRESWKSYVECDKHDVCSCCGISREKIEGSVWGGRNGWTCKPCKEEKDRETRRLAFEKLAGEKPDCEYTDQIICPHCGSDTYGNEVHESQDLECGICGGEFYMEVEYSPIYTTTVKGKRITK